MGFPSAAAGTQAKPVVPRGRFGVLPCAAVPPCPRSVTAALGGAAPRSLRERRWSWQAGRGGSGVVGNIIQRFERRGFRLVAMKLLQVDQGLVDRHYQELRHKPFYPALVTYMTSGPVVAMVWEGYNVVRSTRAMVGDTDSVGTIRGDLSVHISRNVVHASDSVETAQREIGFWFQRDELVDWESRDRDHTYGP
ncbi:nucleoside diphosphate kinase, mitochondrial-like [Manacus vitellinus]|uniref:nucleoside diphosphate kinase, mitochondrial-like n=1 Tax=Manacus vitellinus TaxID=328815 RepID=UPI00115ECA82|nr:nucleoside diphosphate kinase, mitochondrial-like [Manacus vitellinus]